MNVFYLILYPYQYVGNENTLLYNREKPNLLKGEEWVQSSLMAKQKQLRSTKK
jgi:hypothetical protein